MADEPQRADLLRDGARAETGVVQFGSDWPGIFIRGDNAMGYTNCLREIAKMLREQDNKRCHQSASYLERLATLFASSWQNG
jgi:hypothetical protein